MGLSLRRAALGGVVVVALAGCLPRPGTVHYTPDTAPSAHVFWQPPEAERPRPDPALRSLPDLREAPHGKRWSLADVLDVGLRNNPATRAAWAEARAAAASYGVERAAYLPSVGAHVGVDVEHTYVSDTGNSNRQATFGPGVSLSWLLLDFGTRSGALEGARQTLFAANWSQNQVLQDTVVSIEQAYYDYMAARAVAEARRKSLEDAGAQLAAAEGRHAAGVATIADVLQARTARSQAQLALDTTEGLIHTTRGALAVSMGLPANLSFDLEDLPGDVPLEAVARQADDLIAQALARRPELAAARAQVLASDAAVRRVEGQGLPLLTGTAHAAWTWLDVNGASSGPTGGHEANYGGGLVLSVPLFTGYSQTYTVTKTKAQAESARERARGVEQQVVYQVFRGYYALQTATQKARTTEELLASAEQSEQVALGRYKEGVGTILDLLTTQAALAEARAQRVQARWEWYRGLAQLAHDTGLLGLRGETPLAPRLPRDAQER